MNELLAGYEVVKAAGGSGKKTPIVKLTQQEGTYLTGVLLSTKSYTDQDGKERIIANFKALECTAPLIIKGNAGYQPHTFVAGEDVTVYGPPASLARSIGAVAADGTVEMKIVYEGKKRVELGNGKKVNMHTFKVGKKQATLSASADESGVPD